jgi:hypothetical protein
MEKELRLKIHKELEDTLEDAGLIDGGEAIDEVRIEAGELIITVVQ